jgi:uncharacterized protein YdeI (YjbR/CyaY-like superfamily)
MSVAVYTVPMKTEAGVTYFESPDEWRDWLADHGENETEIWIGLYKKDSGKSGITYEQSVNEALCYGWIDGLTKRVDEASYKIRFTPRRSRGNWSASNVARVAALIESGKMTPAGLKHIEAAKADGRWPE